MVFPNEIEVLNGCGASHIARLIVLGFCFLIFVPELLRDPSVRSLQGEVLLVAFSADGGNNSPTVKARGKLPFFIKANSHGSSIFPVQITLKMVCSQAGVAALLLGLCQLVATDNNQ